MASRKLFVGSLPNGIQETTLREEFGRYGIVEDVFIKPGCEMGRQWGFITMGTTEAAQVAKDACDRVLQFPGSERPCDVMVAKNQGMGQEPLGGNLAPLSSYAQATTPGGHQPKKIFVGSLPNAVTHEDISAEFGRYGSILDIHINNKAVELNRQWAFITYENPEQALRAKTTADRQLVFPGSDRAVEVTLARHQGQFGQEALSTDVNGMPVMASQGLGAMPMAAAQGPKKIFVGSLPNQVSAEALQAEFSRYGQVVDVHINTKAVDAGRNWSFITFATPEQAQYAKDATDRILMFPGSDRACEVMLAKNQGQRGQEPISAPALAPAAMHGGGGQPYQALTHAAAIPMGIPSQQPPPPAGPPPASLTPWRMYKTAAGLPYYHNHATGVTVWECPPDLQVPGQGVYGAMAPMSHYPVAHFAPY